LNRKAKEEITETYFGTFVAVSLHTQKDMVIKRETLVFFGSSATGFNLMVFSKGEHK
jgi:hypothetical protein